LEGSWEGREEETGEDEEGKGRGNHARCLRKIHVLYVRA
jgi:hypothetical protein